MTESVQAERMRELLDAAAKTLGDLSDPFTTDWLAEHKVSLNECGDLSQAIATAIKLYLYLPKDERLTYQLKQVIEESELPADAKRYMLASLDFRHALIRINKGEKRHSNVAIVPEKKP